MRSEHDNNLASDLSVGGKTENNQNQNKKKKKKKLVSE